jgi:hypothetical protein
MLKKNEEYNVGAIEIDVSYVIEAWNNNEIYHGICPEIFDIEEADKEYEDYLNIFDNVVLQEKQTHYIVLKSNIV